MLGLGVRARHCQFADLELLCKRAPSLEHARHLPCESEGGARLQSSSASELTLMMRYVQMYYWLGTSGGKREARKLSQLIFILNTEGVQGLTIPGAIQAFSAPANSPNICICYSFLEITQSEFSKCCTQLQFHCNYCRKSI